MDALSTGYEERVIMQPEVYLAIYDTRISTFGIERYLLLSVEASSRT